MLDLKNIGPRSLRRPRGPCGPEHLIREAMCPGHSRCRLVCSTPDFHHWRGACVGTAPPPPSALIMLAGCDTAHAVVTVAITTITVTVMILRISSSILGSISHFHSDCEIN